MASTIQKLKAKLTGEDPNQLAAREEVESVKRDVEKATQSASEKARMAQERLSEGGEEARKALERAEGAVDHKPIHSSGSRLGNATVTSKTTGLAGEGGGVKGLVRGVAERSEDAYARQHSGIFDFDPAHNIDNRNLRRDIGDKIENSSEWAAHRIRTDGQWLADKTRGNDESLSDKVRDTKENIKAKARDAKDTVVEKTREARDTIRDDARAASEKVSETGSTITDSLKGAAHRVEDTLENVKEKIKDATGIGAHHPNDVERQWGRFDSRTAHTRRDRNAQEGRPLTEEGARAAEFWAADKNTETWDLWRRAKHHVHDVLHLKGLHRTELKPRDFERLRSLQHDVAEVRRDYTTHLCAQHPNRLACESTISKIIYNAYEEAQLLKKECKIARSLGAADADE